MSRFAFLFVLFVACDVGSVLNSPDGGGGGMDGSGSGSGSGSAFGTCANVSTSPVAGHMHAAGGSGNSGLNCIMSGCHLAASLGTGAPAYSVAGTLFKDAGGTMVYAGATIEISSAGTVKKLVTDTFGNFYIDPVLFPAPTSGSAGATACPTFTPMVGVIATGDGGCNNCHNTSSTAQSTPINLQ